MRGVCNVCNGFGRIFVWCDPFDLTVTGGDVVCHHCDGRGDIDDDEEVEDD